MSGLGRTYASRFTLPGTDHLLVAGLTVFALVLRVWGLNTDLWLDEITTLTTYMRLPPLEAASVFKTANQHLLNSVLGSISIRIFGESSWTVRLPAVLFGIATIPVFFGLARIVTVRREAVVATLLLTISYHHVWFSQNARGYTAMIFFTTLSTLFLLRAMSGPRRADWLWYSLCGGLGLMSLLNYTFVLAGQVLAVLLSFGGRRQLSSLRMLLGSGLLVLLIAALGYFATLPDMIAYFSSGGSSMGWQNPTAFARVFVAGLIGTLPAPMWPALTAGALVMLVGWLGFLRQQPMIALMLLLPAIFNVLALAVLDFGAYPRSFLYILPFGILVVVHGTFLAGTHLRRSAGFLKRHPRLDYGLPIVVLLAAAAMLPFNYRYPKQDYRGALEYVRQTAQRTDVIAAVGYLASGYRSYYGPDLEFPGDVAELAALSDGNDRVWILYSFTRDMRRYFSDIQDYIDANYQPRKVFPGTLGDGTIYVVASGG